MLQVMLDLETLGTSPGCAVVAIGAVKFDEYNILEELYYRPIWGGKIEHNTVRWWMRQSEKARMELTRDPCGTMEDGLRNLRNFVGDCPVWGNGSDFDNAIIMDCYKKLHIQHWSHRQNRCYRTIRSLVQAQYIPPSVKHNALEDARSQAIHLMKILDKLSCKEL